MGTIEVRLGSKTCGVVLGQPNAMSSSGECTLSPAEAGDAVTVTFSYSGDSVYAPTVSTFKVKIEKSGTLLEISSSPHPSGAGDPIRFSGIVVPEPAVSGVPTGTIEFIDSAGSKLCTATLVSAGRGECTVVVNDVGVKTVTGQYSGDTNFSAKSSALYGHQVSKKCNQPIDPNVIRPPSFCFNTTEYLASGQTRPLTDFIVFDPGNDPLVTGVWFETHFPSATGLTFGPIQASIGVDPQGVTYNVYYLTAFGQNIVELCRGLPVSIPARLQATSASLSPSRPFPYASVSMLLLVEYQRMLQPGPLCSNGQENPYTQYSEDLYLTIPMK